MGLGPLRYDVRNNDGRDPPHPRVGVIGEDAEDTIYAGDVGLRDLRQRRECRASDFQVGIIEPLQKHCTALLALRCQLAEHVERHPASEGPCRGVGLIQEHGKDLGLHAPECGQHVGGAPPKVAIVELECVE